MHACCLQDGLSVENGEGDALTALRHVVLTKDEGAVLGEKVAEHAGKDAAVVAVALAGRVRGAGDQLPLVQVGQRALFLVLVFVLQIAQKVLEVVLAAAAHAVVELDSLLLHKDAGADPVLVVLVDGEEDLVEGKNVLAWKQE